MVGLDLAPNLADPPNLMEDYAKLGEDYSGDNYSKEDYANMTNDTGTIYDEPLYDPPVSLNV